MKNDGANSGTGASAGTSVLSGLAAEVEQQTRAFVEQRPVMAVLMAVSLGFVVARVAARH